MPPLPELQCCINRTRMVTAPPHSFQAKPLTSRARLLNVSSGEKNKFYPNFRHVGTIFNFVKLAYGTSQTYTQRRVATDSCVPSPRLKEANTEGEGDAGAQGRPKALRRRAPLAPWPTHRPVQGSWPHFPTGSRSPAGLTPLPAPTPQGTGGGKLMREQTAWERGGRRAHWTWAPGRIRGRFPRRSENRGLLSGRRLGL